MLRISSRRIYHIYSAIFSVIIFSFVNIQYILLSYFWRPVSFLHSYNSVLRIQIFFLYSYKMWILICKLAHMLFWRKIHNYIIAWKFGSKTFKEAKILSSKKKVYSFRTWRICTDVKYSYRKKQSWCFPTELLYCNNTEESFAIHLWSRWQIANVYYRMLFYYNGKI